MKNKECDLIILLLTTTGYRMSEAQFIDNLLRKKSHKILMKRVLRTL